MATVLGTHKIARRFKDAGVPEAQAEAILDTFVEMRTADLAQLVTKDDLRVGLAELRGELRAEILSVKADLLKWMLPFLAGQLIAILALVVRAYVP